jgi:hypothetical protein
MDILIKELNKYKKDDILLLADKFKIYINEQVIINIAKYIYDNDTEYNKCYKLKKKLTKDCLNKVRYKIYNDNIKFKDNVSKMNNTDLYKIFKSYDKQCFNGDIEKYLNKKKYSLKFKTGNNDTFSTEGFCIFKNCYYVISIPVDKFKSVNGLTNVAGDYCKDQLECLQRVLEHEIVHLIIFLFCGDLNVADQHGRLFMSFVGDIFHHTDHRHYIF